MSTRVLITGASRGIGRGIATAFAGSGAELVVIDHPDADPTPLRSSLPGHHIAWYQQDLAETDAISELVGRIWDECGPIQVLVNNAGVAFMGHFNEIGPNEWRRLMAVNLDAPFFLSQRVAEHLLVNGDGGRIIMISSKNGLVAEPGLAAYNASKGGLELMARSLAVELGHAGITVNTVCPGMIDTDLAEDFPLDWNAFRRYYEEHIPLHGAFGTAADVAAAVLYLASPGARYVTGTALVDGGVLTNQVPRAQFMNPYRSSIERTPAEHQIEICLFVGPRASWDTGVQAGSSGGRAVAGALRGADQLAYGLSDVLRGVELGLRSVLIADLGLLDVVGKLKKSGDLPADLIVKVSASLPVANPATARVMEDLGATTLNLPVDLSLPMLAAIREAVDLPLDLYIESSDDFGGVVRHYEIPSVVRVAAPVHLKFAVRNAPNIYPAGQHLSATVEAMARERVRRAEIGLALLARYAEEPTASLQV